MSSEVMPYAVDAGGCPGVVYNDLSRQTVRCAIFY